MTQKRIDEFRKELQYKEDIGSYWYDNLNISVLNEMLDYIETLKSENAELKRTISHLRIENSELRARLDAYEKTGASAEWLSKAVELDREGRMVVLPIKPGEMLYFPDKDDDGTIFSYECKFTGNIKLICNYFRNDKAWGALLSDIGKTVFLTHEEAEKSVKGV